MVLIKLVNGSAQGSFLTQPWVLTAVLSNMPNFETKLNQMCIHLLSWNTDLSWSIMGTIGGHKTYKQILCDSHSPVTWPNL